MLLDADGRIVRAGGPNVGRRLGRLDWIPGRCIHDAFHAGCDRRGCGFAAEWAQAWERHRDGIAVEWESREGISGARFRMRLQSVNYACRVLFREAVAPFRDFSVLFVQDIGDRGDRRAPSREARPRAADKTAAPRPSPPELTNASLFRIVERHKGSSEAERQRIAADLHDGLGQTLSLLRLELESCIDRAQKKGRPTACRELERAHRYVKDSLAELRRVIRNLRPPALEELGLIGALELLISELRVVCPDVTVNLDLAGIHHALPNDLAVAVYRIAQESINNVARHAHAGAVGLLFSTPDGGVELIVRDDGVGPPAEGFPERGFGFINMRDRTEKLGGSFSVSGAPGQGCTVIARWPADAVRLLS